MWSRWNYFRNIVSLLVNFLVCVLYRFSTYPRSNLLMVFLHCFQTPSHPNAEPQGVLCGGVWTLRSHDCKMLCSSLLNYTCQSPIDCPFVCLSSVPGSAAIIPLWIRRLLILRQWNVIPWLSFFYFSIYFFSFGLGDYLLFGNDLQTFTVQWHPENIKLYLPHMCHYRATSGFSIWQPLLQVHIVASPECLRGFFCHSY